MMYRKRTEDETPHCLECGGEITYARKNKKFCSDGCRARHHNHNHRFLRQYKRMVLTTLDRNYEILEGLVNRGVEAIWIADIIAMGYNPSYVTLYCRHGRRAVCHCYDISYITTDSRMSSISKIQNFSLNLQVPEKGP